MSRSDERVQSAINHWAPRFIANGGDYHDFQRVTNSVERWDDWCQAWSECGAMHEQMAEQAEVEGNSLTAAFHYFHAAISYHVGKALFVQKLDELRIAHTHVVRDYQQALPSFDFPGERVAIPYEGGATMYGILRKPRQRREWSPVVILIPGLDSVKEELHNSGDDFLRRGLAVLAIDGPGQGEMEFEHPMRHDYEVPVRYAIDFLENRTDVDAGRVGLIGVSLGGYYALRAAACESRVKAAIAVAGIYNVMEHFDRLPKLTRQSLIVRSGSTSEQQALEKLEAFHLAEVMEKIRCPLLAIVGRMDQPAPTRDAERIVAEAGGAAELWIFEDGNPVCDNIVYRQRPQRADWMHTQLYSLAPSQVWLP
jgi:2,6-dihydroxypseudooxynicotine hydrolase